MGRKCCVPFCTSNYLTGKKASTFRLPKDLSERQTWLKAIPRDNIPDRPNTVVCEEHWPPGYATTKINGKERPLLPPSVFKGIPASVIPTPQPRTRETKRALSSVRTLQPDELQQFVDFDMVSFEDMCSQIINRDFNNVKVTCYRIYNTLHVQSNKFDSGVPTFLLQILLCLYLNSFVCINYIYFLTRFLKRFVYLIV